MDIKNQFTCFLIGEGTLPIQCADLLLERGHQVKGTISLDTLVCQWAKAKEIPHIQPIDNLVAFLSQQPFDYLFSIVNGFLLPKEILELPRRLAINYHDALLPRYAGVNATSWALMHREKTHGITWHVMSDLVDSGDILKQVSIDIASDETAFTLNGKCYEAAICSFAQLIDKLSSGQALVSKQNLDERTYFPLYKRPRAGGVFSFNRCAHDIDAFVRALDFGPYSNPLGLAKLVIGSSSIIVSKLEVLGDHPKFPPGTVTAIEPSFFKVSTANYSVALHQVLTSDGQELSIPDFVARFGLQVGYRFQDIEPDMVRRIERFNALIAKHEAFWVKRLTTLQPITIPYAQRTASHLKSKHYASVKVPVLHEVTTFLEKCHPAWNQGNFLEAAFVAYLARIGGIGCFDIGFRDVELRQDLVGLESFFASHVPCRVDIEYKQSFEEVFEAFRKQVELTKLHLTYARDVVARYPDLRSLSSPDCDQMLSVVIERVEKLDDYQAGSGNELTLVIPSDGKECFWIYNTLVLDDHSIARMQDQFTIFLQGIVTDPAQRVAYLPLLSEQEHHKILVEWNNTKVEYQQDKCIHQLFEEQVERTPDAVAVMFEDEHLTYRELNCRANQLAHYLQSLGVRPEVLVGICVERSLEMVVGLLGILKAGGAYVPLDPAYPTERLAYMLSDSQVKVLLTQEKLTDSLPVSAAWVIYLDSDWHNIGDSYEENPLTEVKASNLAYMIYTSGTTGKPKGVMIEHQSVVNFTESEKAVYDITQSDRVLQFASIAFDAAVIEIFPCLSAGATLVLRTDDMLLQSSFFVQRCREWEVTIIAWPTYHWHQMMVELAAAQQTLPESLRVLDVGGEAVKPETLKLWQRCVKGLVNPPQLLNGYGPTETTVVATYYDLSEFIVNNPAASSVPIGTPIVNVTTYVLDRHLQPVPIGVTGELHIGGLGLARGYLGRKEVTAEKFIPNPFSNEPSARLYKTGDLVRYLSDGNIEFLGRIDNQVKIRGFRIELGEVEAAIAQHQSVRETVVVAREDVPNHKYLVAYIVPNQSEAISTGNLRGFLKEKLPNYMVPGAFVMLDALPLTPNGKVDRHALRAPELHLELEASFVAPCTPIEEMLACIWANILLIDPVGIHNNFFEMGGHSLLATQVISKVRDTLAVELPLRSLFEAPTIAELAERVEKSLKNGQSQEVLPLLPIPRSESIPLSFAQARLWFLDQLQPNSAFYNIPLTLCLNGQLNITALQSSINEIIQRHEALRTNFAIVEGQPVQIIALIKNLKLLVVDLLHLRESEREIEAQRLATVEANRPFSLEREPLLRGTVLRLGETEYVLLLTMHHIISDGWSVGILFQELATLYTAFCTDKHSILPELPIQYADFAVWQRQWLEQEGLAEQLSYWKRQLEGAPTLLKLPTDRPRSGIQTNRGRHQQFTLSAELGEAIANLSKRVGVTPFMAYFSVFVTLLYRYTGEHDIVVGTPIAGRNRSEIEGIIGLFVNTLVLRTDLSGNPSFEQLLITVREVALQAYANQDLPFEKLVNALQPERSLSHLPLFQVMFALQNVPIASLQLPEITVSSFLIERGTANFDLALSIENTGSGLITEWEYNTDLFNASTIARMARHFQTLLEGIVANPQQRVSQLPLLTERERHQLLVEWNNTTKEYPIDKCIHQLFEEQVTRSPDAIAVVFEGEHLTYRELNAKANQLAHYLLSLGVGPEVLVGICVERSIEMVVAILGILKAGGAYIPLDPRYPKERLAYMILDSQVPILLTQQKLLVELPVCSANVVCLDTGWVEIAAERQDNPVTEVQASNLAYTIYTSGSTGKPKGSLIEHQALVNYTLEIAKQFNLQAGDRFLQFAAIGFDVVVEELFPTWLSGAVVVLPKTMEPISCADLLQLIEKENVTVIELPTVYWHQLVNELSRSPKRAPRSLRLVIIGGETASPEKLATWHKFCIPTVHVYGLTETTVTSIVYHIPSCAQKQEVWFNLPIGRPIANTQIYLLDSQKQPVPIGVIGEIYIGGVGLARGYLNRKDLTDEKFIPDPFNHKDGAHLYKTGDLARYLPDGNIQFLGRIDNQVKIRGFRIELGEIEAAISQHPSVRETMVIAREDVPGQKYLAAYIVPNHDSEIASNDLRSFLKEKLPDYMIPGAFVMLDALPLTPNGKVDRKALPAPQTARQELEAPTVAPGTLYEEILARIWHEVLHVEQIGIHDNFFELGGDSILSILIISRANQAGLQLTPKQIFQHQTIAELASVAIATPSERAQQGLVSGSLPLTPIQHWFFEQNLPEPHHFNQAFLLEVRQALDPNLLKYAVQQLLVHHDALRLRFTKSESGWQQVNALPDETVPLSVIDLSALPETEQVFVIEARSAELQASLNFSTGSLMQAALFNLGSSLPSRLLLVIHHLAVDGVSWRILLEDLQTAYQQLQTGKPIQLPPKTTSFMDWAVKQNQYARSDIARKEIAYWQDISCKQIARLPVDYTVGANTVADARTVSVSLNGEETRALLQDVPKAYRTQINDVLLTTLVQVLAAWIGSRSVLVDLEGHGREEILSDVDLSRTVGWFTTVFPVLLELEATDNLGDTLKSIKEQLRAVPNRGIGYGLLRYLSEDAEIAEKLQALPTAEVSFNYLGQFDWGMLEDSLFKPAKESVGSEHSLQGHRSHLLDVNGLVVEGQLQLDWTYSANYHQRATIEELAREYIEALQSLIAHCQSPDAGGYTPSDFPLAKLDCQKLQCLLAGERDIEDIYPLSPEQQVMLSHTLRTPEDIAYFVQTSFTIHGTLNCSAFKQAWEQFVTIHQVFRTSFHWQELDKPLQVVHSTVDVPWSQHDWQSLTASEQQQQLEVFFRKELELGFQLNKAPLMRFALVKLSSERYKFVWTYHHLLIDGWSEPILLQEVFAFYEALNQSETLQYAPPRPYRDYIGWLLEQDLSQAEAFWRQALLGFTPSALGVRRALEHQDGQKALYYQEQLQLSATVTAALRFVAQQHNLTLNTLVQGAWALLLSRYSGQSDVVFGSTMSGRPPALAGVESMVGMFINTLPVRVQVPEETELLPWLTQLQAQQVEREQYSYTPLMEIHRISGIPQEMPLFESNLRFQNYPTREKLAQQNSEKSLEFSDFDGVDFWNYPLNLVVEPHTELLLLITSDRRCFEAATITQILKDLETLLGNFARELQ